MVVRSSRCRLLVVTCFSGRGHRSEIMFGVLIIVLGANGVSGYSLSTSEFQVSYVVSSCVLDRHVRGASGCGLLRPHTWSCCRLPFAPSHCLWAPLHRSSL